jgi:hypothetical protein
MDVGGGETQQSIPSVDKGVLAAVVLDESLPMVAPIELENKPRRGVVKVGPADEASRGVTEIGLDLGEGQAGLDEEPSQSGLHRRLGRSRE